MPCQIPEKLGEFIRHQKPASSGNRIGKNHFGHIHELQVLLVRQHSPTCTHESLIFSLKLGESQHFLGNIF